MKTAVKSLKERGTKVQGVLNHRDQPQPQPPATRRIPDKKNGRKKIASPNQLRREQVAQWRQRKLTSKQFLVE